MGLTGLESKAPATRAVGAVMDLTVHDGVDTFGFLEVEGRASPDTASSGRSTRGRPCTGRTLHWQTWGQGGDLLAE